MGIQHERCLTLAMWGLGSTYFLYGEGSIFRAVSLWEYMIMMTVLYIYADGSEEQLTVSASDWLVQTTCHPAMQSKLRSLGVIGCEIIKYQPE